jgi:hypothetical protein
MMKGAIVCVAMRNLKPHGCVMKSAFWHVASDISPTRTAAAKANSTILHLILLLCPAGCGVVIDTAAAIPLPLARSLLLGRISGLCRRCSLFPPPRIQSRPSEVLASSQAKTALPRDGQASSSPEEMPSSAPSTRPA